MNDLVDSQTMVVSQTTDLFGQIITNLLTLWDTDERFHGVALEVFKAWEAFGTVLNQRVNG